MGLKTKTQDRMGYLSQNEQAQQQLWSTIMDCCSAAHSQTGFAPGIE
jgi:hypothetical protein